MLHLTNDRNEVVISIGSPGSWARIKSEWPDTIERINTMHTHNHPENEAQEMITEYMEINFPTFVYLVPQLMLCSKYHPQ